jgi:hypothetical protein
MNAFVRGDCEGVDSDSPSMVTKEEKKQRNK